MAKYKHEFLDEDSVDNFQKISPRSHRTARHNRDYHSKPIPPTLLSLRRNLHIDDRTRVKEELQRVLTREGIDSRDVTSWIGQHLLSFQLINPADVKRAFNQNYDFGNKDTGVAAGRFNEKVLRVC